jgi:hypothetical protein
MDNTDIAAISKEGFGRLGQRGVELDRRDLTGRADQLGQNGAIIARAGADMDNAVAGLRRKLLEEFGAQRRAAVVDPRAGSRAMTRS